MYLICSKKDASSTGVPPSAMCNIDIEDFKLSCVSGPHTRVRAARGAAPAADAGPGAAAETAAVTPGTALPSEATLPALATPIAQGAGPSRAGADGQLGSGDVIADARETPASASSAFSLPTGLLDSAQKGQQPSLSATSAAESFKSGAYAWATIVMADVRLRPCQSCHCLRVVCHTPPTHACACMPEPHCLSVCLRSEVRALEGLCCSRSWYEGRANAGLSAVARVRCLHFSH